MFNWIKMLRRSLRTIPLWTSTPNIIKRAALVYHSHHLQHATATHITHTHKITAYWPYTSHTSSDSHCNLFGSWLPVSFTSIDWFYATASLKAKARLRWEETQKYRLEFHRNGVYNGILCTWLYFLLAKRKWHKCIISLPSKRPEGSFWINCENKKGTDYFTLIDFATEIKIKNLNFPLTFKRCWVRS